MLTDGGIRVPFLDALEGRLPAGRVEPRAVSSWTWPRPRGAGGCQSGAGRRESAPFLTGESASAADTSLFWRWRSQAAVFDGRWKLLVLAPDRWLLFDH